MKRLITVILLLICFEGIGQLKVGTMPYTYKVKEQAPILVCTFIGGVFEGAMDQLDFHYSKPNQYWNPDLSYVNKYIDHDPTKGTTWRGKYLTFTTDGWHLMKFGNHMSLMTAVMLKSVFSFGVKKKWYWYVMEVLTYWGANRLGFQVTYNLIKF